MEYKPKNFDQLLGVEGFSDAMFRNHFTLYQGYVNNTNKIMNTLRDYVRQGKQETAEFSELKRRFGWEFNGMRLHELYFGNLKKKAAPFPRNSELGLKIANDFGSYEYWEKEFKGIGTMRGNGWAVLCLDPAGDTLLNVWINEHDQGLIAGSFIILAMDCFEHAYFQDYGIKRADYITNFFRSLDWDEVQNRYHQVVLEVAAVG